MGVPPRQPAFGTRITRRKLLQGGAVAVVALAISESFGTTQATSAAPVAQGLRRSDYSQYVGHQFRLTVPGGVALTIPLVAVEDLRGPADLSGSEDAFALVFHAPAAAPRLEQAVVNIGHPRGWSRPLLIASAGTGRRGIDYATVINRAPPRRGRENG